MRFIPFFALLASICPVIAAPPESWQIGEGVEWSGEGATFAEKKGGAVTVEISPASDQALALILQQGGARIAFTFLTDGVDSGRLSLRKDEPGENLRISVMELDEESGKWQGTKGEEITLPYRPAEKAARVWENLETHKLEPQSWPGRQIELRIIRRADQVEIYFDGVLVSVQPAAENEAVGLRIELAPGDTVRPVRTAPFPVMSTLQPLAIKAFVPGSPKSDHLETVDGIPFLRPEGNHGVDLRRACWPFAEEMPGNYFASYDSGPMFLHDPRVPTFWAPVANYSALHLLVRRTPEAPEQSERFSVRVGSVGMGPGGGRGQVLQHDYHAEIPSGDGEQILTVPITEVIAQDLKDRLQISLNRELYLSRRSPDPSRFEIRPLGLPPGIEILGATLERASIQMEVTATEPGSVFEGDKQARYTAGLHNITGKPLDYTLVATSTDSGGREITETFDGQLAPQEKREVALTIDGAQWGYYELHVRLDSKGLKHPLKRRTTFALLPPDTRQHRAQSPFGTWTFSGAHMTIDEPDVEGSLLKKAGLRFGMGRVPEARAKWGVQNNFEIKAITTPEKYEKWRKKNPDALPVALLMHEHAISADHATRVPDIFTGRKPYQLSPEEKGRFDTLWEEQIQMARLMREHFPEVHLRLGNGPLTTKEEFLRAGFPAELFDSLGNEAGSFGRLPERQPPDTVANNASLWMDHELLKAYGYDKPVTQCYEITYPSTNPGNLALMDQAAYFLRHGLHSMAWGIPEIRFGCLDDAGNAYRFSNWGASGMLNAWPHLNPKPAYVAVATLTRMLDGAKFQKTLNTSSASVYALEFLRPDQRKLYVLWTLRGVREVSLSASGQDWTVGDWEGNESSADLVDGKFQALLNSMPIFVVGSGAIGEIALGEPVYAEKPDQSAQSVAKLASLENWEVQTAADPVLESHNPMCPRRPGNFQYEVEADAIRVRADKAEGPKALPMYGALMAKNPLKLPGQPTEIGLWVEGNGGWGRVIFELEDAKGQKWTSIGASRKGEISEWMLDWLPAEFATSKDSQATQADWNTNDVFGLTSINFDGWRYVRFPLPGNFPGAQVPWPANSQWRFDKDGVVNYPLKLTRLIFELPENVLKLTDYMPVKNQFIRVKDLVVEYGTQGNPKQGVYESDAATGFLKD